jgi:hypothetical protein
MAKIRVIESIPCRRDSYPRPSDLQPSALTICATALCVAINFVNLKMYELDGSILVLRKTRNEWMIKNAETIGFLMSFLCSPFCENTHKNVQK